jgi:hypothetical protein
MFSCSAKFVMNESDDNGREWIKSVFVDIPEHLLKHLSRYVFSCLCNDPYFFSSSSLIGRMAAATACALCVKTLCTLADM